jgi:UDP-glucose 4-epimerase
LKGKRSLAGRSVMVTGGAGFIGSHLCDRIMQDDPSKLVILDNFSLGKMRNVWSLRRNPKVRIHRRDGRNFSAMEKVLRDEEVEIIFNLAVIPLPMSLELPMETVMTNVAITTNLCELLRRKAFESLLHCSSSEAYGTALYVPMDEKHPEKPLTPYAASKIACDQVAVSFFKTFGLDIAIARPFNAYGPRQNERSYAGVIPLTILRILEGKPPVVFGDGKQTRDYSYVADTVEGIMGVFACPEAQGMIVNIASGREIRIGVLIEKIAKIMGYEGEIVRKPARPGDVLRHKGDIALAKRLFNYAPRTNFDDGLRHTVDWYASELKSYRHS